MCSSRLFVSMRCVALRCVALLGASRRFLDRDTTSVRWMGKVRWLPRVLVAGHAFLWAKLRFRRSVGLVGICGVDAKQESRKHPERAGPAVPFFCVLCGKYFRRCGVCCRLDFGRSLASAVPVATTNERDRTLRR